MDEQGTTAAEQLLQEARAGSRSLDDAMAALVESEIVVLFHDLPEPDDTRAAPVTVTGNDGSIYVAVFTSEERVPDEAPPAKRLRAPLRTLLQGGWPDGVGLVVNPGHDNGVTVPADAIATLAAAGGLPADEAPGGMQVALGEPEVEPAELLAKFTAAAEQQPAARALYRAQAVWRGREDEPSLLVGILVEPPTDPDEVVSAIVEAVGATTERYDAFGFTEAETGSDPLVAELVTRPPSWARD